MVKLNNQETMVSKGFALGWEQHVLHQHTDSDWELQHALQATALTRVGMERDCEPHLPRGNGINDRLVRGC